MIVEQTNCHWSEMQNWFKLSCGYRRRGSRAQNNGATYKHQIQWSSVTVCSVWCCSVCSAAPCRCGTLHNLNLIPPPGVMRCGEHMQSTISSQCSYNIIALNFEYFGDLERSIFHVTCWFLGWECLWLKYVSEWTTIDYCNLLLLSISIKGASYEISW